MRRRPPILYNCCIPSRLGKEGPTPADLLNDVTTRRLAHEYRSRSLYRVSGGALIAAAALFTLSLLTGGGTLPPGLPGLRAASSGLQVTLLWLCAPAPTLAAGGVLGITRHYRGTSKEGWVLLAFTVAVVGSALLTLTFALGMVAGPALAGAAQVDAGAARAALAPLSILSRSASTVGGVLFWLSLLPLSVALTRDRLWPHVTAWGAAPVGVVEAAGPSALVAYPTAAVAVRLLGCAYLALLGVSALGMVRVMRAAAAEAARSED